ncbi:MAG: RecX family transcriptional regulator [Telmatospirillum sp.]|nr:RecX family transcriptional regulator [Telmatospirillum sp.]
MRSPTGRSPTGRPVVRRVTAASLENSALHYLSRFAATEQALRRVLMRKVDRAAQAHGDDPAEGGRMVEALIARYRRAGLLDDRRFAEGRTQTLLARGAPLRSIRQTLCRQGVDGDLAGAVIDALREELADRGEDADLEAALAYARRRRLGPHRPEEKRALWRDKDLASMGRAGFSWELARRVIDGDKG